MDVSPPPPPPHFQNKKSHATSLHGMWFSTLRNMTDFTGPRFSAFCFPDPFSKRVLWCHKKGDGNQSRSMYKKGLGTMNVCPYRNFSHAIKNYPRFIRSEIFLNLKHSPLNVDLLENGHVSFWSLKWFSLACSSQANLINRLGYTLSPLENTFLLINISNLTTTFGQIVVFCNFNEFCRKRPFNLLQWRI